MDWTMDELALWTAFLEEYPFDVLPDQLAAQMSYTTAIANASGKGRKLKFDDFLWFRKKPKQQGDMRQFLLSQKRMQKRK